MNIPIMKINQKHKFLDKKLSFGAKIGGFLKDFGSLLLFIIIVGFYVLHIGIHWLLKPRRFTPVILSGGLQLKLETIYARIMSIIDPEPKKSFNRSYLIELSLKNMRAKKTRTMVTMGGMAIGIAFIVFLVSVGYGLQNMVVSRVARLDELKQTDVVPGLSADLTLTDETMTKFSAITNVKDVLPVIAVVGKISYQNSVSDMAVYGVTTDYLKNSAIQPIRGKIFDNANMVTMIDSKQGQVAGVSTASQTQAIGDTVGDLDFVIEPSSWLRVRESASPKGKLLGYTRRVEGKQSGVEVIGEYYLVDAKDEKILLDAEGNKVSKWVKTKVPLWEKKTCNTTENAACEDGSYLPVISNQDSQEQVEGYIAEVSMDVRLTGNSGNVLGVTTDNTTGSLPIVNIASESATTLEQQKKVLEISKEAKRLAVVNRSTLQVLNLTEAEAVGKKVSLTFVVVGDLIADQKEKIESAPSEYTIIGVTPDEGTPMVYVPFIDLRSLGITKYSQMKIIVNDTGSLAKVRATVEAGGYGTISVADTVAQIDKLFASFRLVLAILGMVALSVAALGMFNTLTVSLLERTREVGLMKAMGMKSSEVKDLFLTESMIMGFFGGVIGLVAGTLIGKILSLILTAFSLVKGVGTVDISFVPPIFVFAVLVLSVVVGILTGYFPAKRATKISALNALRYE